MVSKFVVDDAFLLAVGRFTVAWSRLELGIDGMIWIMHTEFGEKEFQKKFPQPLAEKIRYLRSAMQRRSFNVDQHAKLFDAIEGMADDRHSLIHGAMVEKIEESGEMRMIRLIHAKSGLQQMEFRVTADHIHASAEVVEELCNATMAFSEAFWLWVEDLRKRVEEVPMS